MPESISPVVVMLAAPDATLLARVTRREVMGSLTVGGGLLVSDPAPRGKGAATDHVDLVA
jgi:hypothetical protein